MCVITGISFLLPRVFRLFVIALGVAIGVAVGVMMLVAVLAYLKRYIN